MRCCEVSKLDLMPDLDVIMIYYRENISWGLNGGLRVCKILLCQSRVEENVFSCYTAGPVGNAYYKMGGSPGVGTPNPTPPLDVPRENAWTGICHSRVRYSTIIQGPVGTA